MTRVGSAILAFVLVTGSTLSAADSPDPRAPQRASEPSPEARVVARARIEVEREVSYDPAYVRLSFRDGTDTRRTVYPGGDLDPKRGVCTDVVIRALRAVGIDLQEKVHADILARPSSYRSFLTPDTNIDHRRVGPLLTYFRAHADAPAEGDWKPADIIVWSFGRCPRCTPDHIGVVSDRLGPRGLPLVIHNMGPKPTEDDVLGAWTVLGHFRVVGEGMRF